MHSQAPHSVLVIRPSSFGFNPQTVDSNAFQSKPREATQVSMPMRGLQEFDSLVKVLKAAGVQVIVSDDTPLPPKPDAVFPNNWVSFHHDGTVIVYPLLAENRRAERRIDIIYTLQKKFRFNVTRIIDLSMFELDQKYLEGTGSLVFDYRHKTAYAALSPRTHPGLIEIVCAELGYRYLTFNALDMKGREIYHTNVMMCIGEKYVILCTDTLRDPGQRKKVLDSLADSGLELIEITMDQMCSFAGNMIELKNGNGEHLLLMSGKARNSLSGMQLEELCRHATPVEVDIPTIETIGGGGARCMLAGIFLPSLSR